MRKKVRDDTQVVVVCTYEIAAEIKYDSLRKKESG